MAISRQSASDPLGRARGEGRKRNPPQSGERQRGAEQGAAFRKGHSARKGREKGGRVHQVASWGSQLSMSAETMSNKSGKRSGIGRLPAASLPPGQRLTCARARLACSRHAPPSIRFWGPWVHFLARENSGATEGRTGVASIRAEETACLFCAADTRYTQTVTEERLSSSLLRSSTREMFWRLGLLIFRPVFSLSLSAQSGSGTLAASCLLPPPVSLTPLSAPHPLRHFLPYPRFCVPTPPLLHPTPPLLCP